MTERAPAADAPPRRRWPRRHPVATTAIGLASTLVLAVTIVVFTPVLDSDLRSDAAPATSYADAMVLADGLLAADGSDVNPLCRSEVRDQGERTDVAYHRPTVAGQGVEVPLSAIQATSHGLPGGIAT